ncbi:hypothetical protein VKT23_009408 [Stygiomarasmius scandens]|uniref:Uncharacterized protein n=1 Tax=Marasmiellus scandens TaxID=2682957 RepID=A0ABR1JFE8_9AGAR
MQLAYIIALSCFQFLLGCQAIKLSVSTNPVIAGQTAAVTWTKDQNDTQEGGCRIVILEEGASFPANESPLFNCGPFLDPQGTFEFSAPSQPGTFDFEFWVVQDASGTFISDPFQAEDPDTFKFTGTILAKSEPFTVIPAI